VKKVKLIIGTVNSGSLLVGEQKLEEIYERSYKPFLRFVHRTNLPVTMYYSGELLSWLIDKHDGVQMLFNDIYKSRKIEILGGGYYSPLFSLIPRKDRVSQIELMTTEIRKRFGKRTRGMWITEKVWEPSMPMTMNYSGMEFTFLDEEFFEDAGLFNGELYQPCMTEDQGKKVVIFPISNRLISQFSIIPPEEMLEQIIECGSDKEERVITLLLDGEDLDFTDQATEQRLERFYELVHKNRKKIDVVLPGKLVREYGRMKKVYFGCVSPGDIGRWSGPVFREHVSNENEASGPSKGVAAQAKPVNTQSFFRHFLAKYPESNFLYSRMIDLHMLISQVRGDKQRKKSAEIELYKSQNHSAYWHGGGSPGIYSAEGRRLAYAALIEAEKFTREKGGFRASIVKDDFDMDGLDEFIYRGLSLNANIHRKGGSVFELDYFRTPHNYQATMARHREWYHESDAMDLYTRNSFIDHFLRPDEKIENFYDMSYTENGDFISGLYEVEKFNKERKEVSFSRNGSIITRKSKFSVQLSKKYSFKRNNIIIDYEIVNKSDAVLTTRFASEINLAFSSENGPMIDITTTAAGIDKKQEEELFTQTDVSELQIFDKARKANVIFDTDSECDLWGFPIKTKTGTGKVVEELYQSNCFVPIWNLSLAPGKSWTNRLQFRIERKSGKSN